jgi:hypothetical protein
VVICATLISNAKLLGSILLNVNLYFINTKYGALSEFNHGLGRVESIRSPSVLGPRIRAIRVICPDSIRTQLGHGLPIKQDMHPNRTPDYPYLGLMPIQTEIWVFGPVGQIFFDPNPDKLVKKNMFATSSIQTGFRGVIVA